MPDSTEHIELVIEKLVPGGKGLARHEGFVFFVDRGLPGQRLLVRIDALKKRHGQASILQVLSPAPDQIPPLCPHFGACGGCSWQHLAYPSQLFWKEQFVRESLQRIGGQGALEHTDCRPIIPSPETWFYRNKMEFAFAPPREQGARPLLGLKRRASNAVVEVSRCRLQSERAMQLLEQARASAALCKAPAYDVRTGAGYWRYLVLRENSREMTAQLLTTGQKEFDDAAHCLANELLQTFPWLTGVVHAYRDSSLQVALGERDVRVFGDERLEFALGRTRYAVATNDFFQPNAGAARHMYDTARDLAGLQGGEVVWDLYCGAGGAGLHMAGPETRLVGFDISREALADAGKNAARNGIRKARFHAGDLRRTLRRESGAPDVLLTDPPRSGMAPEVLQQIMQRAPQKIISIACDPATQARDIGKLAAAYELRAVQPVDMFPHTPHVENVALLTRKI